MSRHEWTSYPDGLGERAYLLFVTALETGEPATNASAEELAREILRLAGENVALKRVGGFDKIGADRLADEVASLVARGLLDARSGAADALLDYREPPRSERSDRLADLDAERDRLLKENATLRADQQAGIAALEAAGRQLLAEGADPGFWFDDHPPGADHWPDDLGRLMRQAARNERARISQEPAAGLDAHVRFGKEVAGCVVDCYVDATGAEWVPLNQALDAANRQVKSLAEEKALLNKLCVRVETVTCADGYRDMTLAQMHGLVTSLAAEQARPLEAERARLAAEVERLKAEVKAHEEAGPAALRVGRVQGEAEERARIRRELLAEILQQTSAIGRGPSLGRRNLRSIIDRIVPGEG